MPGNVTYFRSRVDGPEAKLEDAVAASIHTMFARSKWPNWIGGQLRIGAGIPDLVSIWYQPIVEDFSSFTAWDEYILAYLNSVDHATGESIAAGIGSSEPSVASRLRALEDARLVRAKNGAAFQIAPRWKRILPDVVAIEAKVGDWRQAIEQARRNSVFATRSFVALPVQTARRLLDKGNAEMYGVGVIAVSDDGEASIARLARRTVPTVWQYYFKLAALTAQQISGGCATCLTPSILPRPRRSSRTTSSSRR